MSLPPLPKGFSGAFDLSSLKAPAVDTSTLPGTSVTQENLVKEVLPRSANKVIVLICWSPRSPQSLELIETIAKFNESDKGENEEAPWELAHVNVDKEAQVAQALQVQTIPFAVGIIAQQPVPLFENVPPNDQIRLVLNKVLELAAQKGVGSAPAEGSTEVPIEPEEAEAMSAMEIGDFPKAEIAFNKWINRQPGNEMAKLGLAQVQLLIRIKDLDPAKVLADAIANPNDLKKQIQAADIEIANGNNKEAFDRLINAVKTHSGDEQKEAREHLLTLFSLVDPSNPDLIKARQQLASALY
jgi:putative thioredoxin